VTAALDERVNTLDGRMSYHLTEHIDTLYASLNRSMASMLQYKEDTSIMSKAQQLYEDLKVEKKGQAWMIPFLILVVLMIGGAVGLYLFYEKMRKMHLL
jgi:hypothetical protein